MIILPEALADSLSNMRRHHRMLLRPQHNRRVRKVELDKIDFGKGAQLVHQPMDKENQQDIEDVTPLGK